jgi:hypothetical protein
VVDRFGTIVAVNSAFDVLAEGVDRSLLRPR